MLGKGGVVVDNIVGAGGILAGQSVARMPPDGYNLLLGSSAQVVQKVMEPSVKFDPLKDFAHVTRTAFSPSILVVSASSPYQSVQDLLAADPADVARLVGAPPGAEVIAYCHSGNRSELASQLLRAAGYEARNYVGSWHEWSRDLTLPAEP